MNCSYGVVCALLWTLFTCYASGDADHSPDFQQRVAQRMYEAASAGQAKLLYYLCTTLRTEFEASVNHIGNTKDGYTLLHNAVRSGSYPSVHLLLEAGADPNVLTVDGDTPYSLAREAGSRGILALLRRYGAQDPYKQELSSTNQKALVERALDRK